MNRFFVLFLSVLPLASSLLVGCNHMDPNMDQPMNPPCQNPDPKKCNQPKPTQAVLARQDLVLQKTGYEPASVLAVDINKDHADDIAFVVPNQDEIYELMQKNAQNGFEPAIRLSIRDKKDTSFVPKLPSALAIEDVNGDGKLDFLTANQGREGSITTILTQVDGTLGEPQDVMLTYQTGPDKGKTKNWTPTSLHLATIEQAQSAPHLLVTDNKNNQVVFFKNQGNGQFAQTLEMDCQNPPVSLTTADINGDKLIDFAVATSKSQTGPSEVWFAFGVAKDGYKTFDNTHLSVPDVITSILLTDQNHDGKPDLVVALKNGQILFYIQEKSGKFPPTASSSVFLSRGVGDPVIMSLGPDLDGDGNAEILIANSQSISIISNQREGKYSFYTTQTGSNSIAFGKLTGGDDIVDLVVANGDSGSLSLFPGKSGLSLGQTDFDSNTMKLLGGNPISFQGLFLAKTAPQAKDPSLFILDANTQGIWRAADPHSPFSRSDLPANANLFSVADIDGDQGMDFISVDSTPGKERLWISIENQSVQFSIPLPTNSKPTALLVADLNVDQKPDVLLYFNAGTEQGLSYWKGDGQGKFTQDKSVTFPSLGTVYTLQALSFQADQKPTLFAISSKTGNRALQIFTPNAQGNYLDISQEFPGFFNSMRLADMNADQKLDLLATRFDTNEVWVLQNQDQRSFSVGQKIPVGEQPNALEVADMNGDHQVDMIVTNGYDNTIQVLYQTKTGAFDPSSPTPVGFFPKNILVGDWNHDGQPDILVGNGGSFTLSLFLSVQTSRF